MTSDRRHTVCVHLNKEMPASMGMCSEYCRGQQQQQFLRMYGEMNGTPPLLGWGGGGRMFLSTVKSSRDVWKKGAVCKDVSFHPLIFLTFSMESDSKPFNGLFFSTLIYLCLIHRVYISSQYFYGTPLKNRWLQRKYTSLSLL